MLSIDDVAPAMEALFVAFCALRMEPKGGDGTMVGGDWAR
jgi:hypothetical protein